MKILLIHLCLVLSFIGGPLNAMDAQSAREELERRNIKFEPWVFALHISNRDISVNSRNHEGDTALSYAALYGHSEIVEFLIDKGGDTDIQDIIYEHDH